jgi:hypothetical protein
MQKTSYWNCHYQYKKNYFTYIYAMKEWIVAKKEYLYKKSVKHVYILCKNKT